MGCPLWRAKRYPLRRPCLETTISTPKGDRAIKAASAHASDRPGIVVYHDYFAIRGGGERLVLELARGLSAALVYGYRTAETYSEADLPENCRDLALPAVLRRPGLRPLALALAFRRRRQAAVHVPVRIFSGVAALFAAPPKAAGARNIFYCHTPPRFLFDQRDHFVGGLPIALKPFASLLLWLYGRAYRRAVDRMDVIVTNSENTRRRIARFLGRDSTVVYPPIDTSRFRFIADGGYFLSTARLSPLKRVDMIVRAFRKMPDRKLIVVSGGGEYESLVRLAGGAANIEFRGWVGEDELTDLVGNATATIYLPIDEDFGMSPVESMAAGKPVIGVSEGGLLETILPDETGILLPKDVTENDIIAATELLTPERAAAMRRACERRASEFSSDRFLKEMRRLAFDYQANEKSEASRDSV